MTDHNCSGWISPKRGVRLRVEPTLVTTLAERYGCFTISINFLMQNNVILLIQQNLIC